MTIPRIIREPVLGLLGRLGYGVYKINTDRSLHGPVVPGATYSPWNQDTRFLSVYQAVRHHTLVDIYRCYELWTLVHEVAQLEGDLIEVGVWRGGTGVLIAKRARLSGIAGKVYLCDTFAGVVKASDKDPSYVGGEHADTSRPEVEALVAQLGVENVEILQGIFPDDTGAGLEGTRFRFCHVDVDVYQSAKDIVQWVWSRLVVGGVVVYDDFGTESTAGITQLVEEQRGQRDRITIHNLNGHAITIKLG